MVDNVLPLTLDGMTAINIDLHWTYGLGTTPVESTVKDELENDVEANVAIDMFLDSDETTAQNSTAAKYEVMVWFGHWFNADPIGQTNGVVTTRTINGTIL